MQWFLLQVSSFILDSEFMDLKVVYTGYISGNSSYMGKVVVGIILSNCLKKFLLCEI
jgi:hypothetical protein